MGTLAVAEPAMSTSEREPFLGEGLRTRLTVRAEPVAVTRARHAEPVVLSPELVLVCPELRELALQQLPERDPEGFLPRPRREQPPDDTRGTAQDDSSFDAWEPEGSADPPLVVSLLAYTAQQSVSMALHGVGVIAATSGLIVLLTQFHR